MDSGVTDQNAKCRRAAFERKINMLHLKYVWLWIYKVWIMFSYEPIKFLSEKWCVPTIVWRGLICHQHCRKFNESTLKMRKAVTMVCGQQKPLLWEVPEWWDPRIRRDAVGMVGGDARSRANCSPLPFIILFQFSWAFVPFLQECNLSWGISALVEFHLWNSQNWVGSMISGHPMLSSELYTCLKWGGGSHGPHARRINAIHQSSLRGGLAVETKRSKTVINPGT